MFLRKSVVSVAVMLTSHVASAQIVPVERQAVASDISVIAVSEETRLVKAKVQLGSNSCTSDGLEASLLLTNESGELSLTPIVVGEQDSSKFCIQIYEPVFQEVSIALSSAMMFNNAVILKNAEAMGQDLNLATGKQTSSDACVE